MNGQSVADYFKNKDNSQSNNSNNNTVDALKQHILNKRNNGDNNDNVSSASRQSENARHAGQENIYNSERGHGINETSEQRARMNREHEDGMEM